MEIRRIKYFVAIAESENMHRAAEKLHVAQPAMTRQIKLLEDELGVSLFERLPRGLRLSSAGKCFLDDARKILRITDLARRRVQSFGRGRAGTLRVGLHEAVPRFTEFTHLLQAFAEIHPAINFELRSASSQQQLDGLRAGTLDLAFVFNWDRPPSNIDTLLLRSDDYAVVMPHTHRFAQVQRPDLAAFVDEPFVWIDRTLFRHQSELLIAACQNAGFVPRIVYEGLSSEGAVVSLVAAGLGCAFLPASLSEQHQRGIVVRQATGLHVPIGLHMAWHADNDSTNLLQILELARSAGHSPPAQAGIQVNP